MSDLIHADLHFHTMYSRDCQMRPAQIIATAKKRGIDCIAFTDHNTTRGGQVLKQMAPAGLTVIVSEEVKTIQGEIIGYFLKEDIPSKMSPAETVAAIKEQGGLVSVPHPFDRVRKSRLAEEALLAIVSDIDILEIRNSRTTFEVDNVRAAEFAARHNLLRCGGSDSHCVFEIGNTYVEMPAFGTKEEFLRSLAQGTVIGRRSNPAVHFYSMWAKWKKRLFPTSAPARPHPSA